MKKLLVVGLAASLVAVLAVPSSAQNPPYKIPPGQYCKGESKKKIPGQKKTPFAQCVTAMAKITKNESLAPSQACASLKQIKGKKNQNKRNRGRANRAFKICVQAGKKLKLDLANAAA